MAKVVELDEHPWKELDLCAIFAYYLGMNINISMNRVYRDRIRDKADLQGISVSELVRRAIDLYLEKEFKRVDARPKKRRENRHDAPGRKNRHRHGD